MFHQIKDKWASIWFWSFVGVSVFLIITTFFIDRFSPSNFKPWAPQQFQLAMENNVASWWSGMLLLVIALHASDGYFSNKHSQRLEATGWGSLAIIFTILSLDEIGSLHERASKILPLGGVWWSLLPFAVILFALLLYAFYALKRSNVALGRLLLIAAGFFCLSTIALQEFLEHRVTWEPWMRPFRRTIEEGTELLGMLILLKATLPNTGGIFDRRPGAGSTFEILSIMPRLAVPVSILLAPFVAFLSDIWANEYRGNFKGHPADWLAAALFQFAALSISNRFFKEGTPIKRGDLSLIALCCFASMASVAFHPNYSFSLPFMPASFRMMVFFFLSIAICSLWAASRSNQKDRELVCMAAILVIAIASVFTLAAIVQYGAPIVIGALVYYVSNARATER